MKEQIDKVELQQFVITLSDCQHKYDKEVNKAIVTRTPLPKENKFYARYLTEQGYRKQEWISVEDRLPKVDTDVLVITANGSFKVARCNIYHNGTLVLWMTNDGLGEKAITHWMPLPEPPKMKGGAE